MILVTVGTHNQDFDRLIRSMDELASTIEEKVVIQTGCSTFAPQHATHFQRTTSQQMEQLTQEARIVVSHAGSGTAVITLRNKKPLVLVPRRHQYGEHNDDHQLQLAEALAHSEKAILVKEPSAATLLTAIDKAARELKFEDVGPDRLMSAIRTQLDNWAAIDTAQ